MNGYLLDTNIVTAPLKRHPVVSQRIRDAELTGYPVRLTAVSYYETKRGLLAMGVIAPFPKPYAASCPC